METARKRSFPKQKDLEEGGTAKDKLYNDVISVLEEKHLDFPYTVAEEDGGYIVQVYMKNINIKCISKCDICFRWGGGLGRGEVQLWYGDFTEIESSILLKLGVA